MSRARLSAPGPSRTCWPDARRFASARRSAAPALLFGLRLWGAVCLALYIAFQLELDNAYWAGTSAAIVCQPSLGASLRKGWFRMIGTAVGAVAIVALTACFPQDRVGFLLGLALWGAACGLVATLLRNLLGGPGRLHGGDHRKRRARRDRGCERRGIHARHQPRQRDLHRHHLRRRHTCRDRLRRRAAPAGRPACVDFG
jgi:hypothetical protein